MNSKPTRILIVDDDDDIRANIADILIDLGYTTDVAENGNKALEIISEQLSEEQEFDLCLLDFKMPGMDGAELFERIQKACPDLRAIMMTAYAGEDGVKRALDAGTWKVLRKPVDVRVLLSLIQEATDE